MLKKKIIKIDQTQKQTVQWGWAIQDADIKDMIMKELKVQWC